MWLAAGPDIQFHYSWEGAWLVGSAFVTLVGGTYDPQWATNQPIEQQPEQTQGLVAGNQGFGSDGDIQWPVLYLADVICECDGHPVVKRAPGT